LMREVLQPDGPTTADRRERQLKVVRRLWRVLFSNKVAPEYA
jgi:hypothetical protein